MKREFLLQVDLLLPFFELGFVFFIIYRSRSLD